MAKKQPEPENMLDELDREQQKEAPPAPAAAELPAEDVLPEIPEDAEVPELEALEQSRPIYRPICKMHKTWMVSGGSHLHFTYYRCPVEGCTSNAKVPRKTPAQVLEAGGERGFEAR